MLSSRKEPRQCRQPLLTCSHTPLLAQARAPRTQISLRVLCTQKPTRGYRVSWLQAAFKYISQTGKLRLQLALTQLQWLRLC